MDIRRFFAAILAVMLFAGVAALAEESVTAWDFTVLDLDSNEVSLHDKMDGRPMILNFWASWCPPCVAELGYFDEAAKQYGDQIVFMMINLTDGGAETFEGAKAFIEEKGFTFPVYFDTQGIASGMYVGQYVPITWLINADGTLYGYMEGGMQAETLESLIQMILAD